MSRIPPISPAVLDSVATAAEGLLSAGRGDPATISVRAYLRSVRQWRKLSTRAALNRRRGPAFSNLADRQETRAEGWRKQAEMLLPLVKSTIEAGTEEPTKRGEVVSVGDLDDILDGFGE